MSFERFNHLHTCCCIPYPDCGVVRARDNVSPIWRECHRFNQVGMSFERFNHLHTCPCIPYPDCLIIRARGNPSSIWGDTYRDYWCQMPTEFKNWCSPILNTLCSHLHCRGILGSEDSSY